MTHSFDQWTEVMLPDGYLLFCEQGKDLAGESGHPATTACVQYVEAKPLIWDHVKIFDDLAPGNVDTFGLRN